MSTQLTFQGVCLNPIQLNQQIWLSSSELTRALGYKDSKSVNKIYARNEDEFNDQMTLVVNLTPSHKKQDPANNTRIFSLRGCHLVAMFARTAVAKEFRKWVLDVLDKETNPQACKPQAERQSTATQLIPLRQKVEQLITTGVGNIYGDIWKLVHNKFEVKTISQLRPEQIVEAVQYLDAIEGEYIAKNSQPEPAKYFYPKSYAEPHSREFENALLTPSVLLDDRNRAIELELLDELERDGYDVSGVRLRVLALRYAAKQHLETQRDLSNLKYYLNQMNRAVDDGRKVFGLNVDFGNQKHKRLN
ncbi:TPA: Bro-N domain-containing protein [Vibrio vulnificus]